VVSLDQSGSPKKVENLEVKVYKVRWRWWWQSSSGSLSRYESEKYREQVYSTTISTSSNGMGSFSFKNDENDWGRHLVRIRDPKSGHATGKIIYLDYPYWRRGNRKANPENASMLIFNADKDSYTVGETAQITFPSAAGGRALVTVENGTETLDAQWVDTTKDQTKVSFYG